MRRTRAAIWASFAAAFVLENTATQPLSAAEILTEDLRTAPRLAFDADIGKATSAIFRDPSDFTWRFDSTQGRISGDDARAFATHFVWQEGGEALGAFASNGHVGSEQVSQFALEFSSVSWPSGLYAVVGYQTGDFETQFVGFGGYFLLSPDTLLKISSSLDFEADSFGLGLQFGKTSPARRDWDFYFDSRGSNGDYRALAGIRIFFGDHSAPNRTEPADLFPNAAVGTLVNIVSGNDASIVDAADDQEGSGKQDANGRQNGSRKASGVGVPSSKADTSKSNGHGVAAEGNGGIAPSPPSHPQ